MIEKLLEIGDGKLIVPLIVVSVGMALAKGLFSFSRSRSQDRKDFLDLFRAGNDETDLWITVSIRHVFGAYLPASLIRQLMSGPQPGRALLEVANAWDFIDMDDETGELFWRRKILRSVKARLVLIRVLAILYFVLASISLFLAYLCLTGSFDGRTLWIAWAYVLLSGGVALGALMYGDNLRDAHKVVHRWLGMT